jgi:hypothetical protein
MGIYLQRRSIIMANGAQHISLANPEQLRQTTLSETTVSNST